MTILSDIILTGCCRWVKVCLRRWTYSAAHYRWRWWQEPVHDQSWHSTDWLALDMEEAYETEKANCAEKKMLSFSIEYSKQYVPRLKRLMLWIDTQGLTRPSRLTKENSSGTGQNYLKSMSYLIDYDYWAITTMMCLHLYNVCAVNMQSIKGKIFFFYWKIVNVMCND